MSEIPTIPRRGRGLRLAASVAALAGCGALVFGFTTGKLPALTLGKSTAPYKLVTATKGPLTVTVVGSGAFESSKSRDVVNMVEGQTTILSILPEGTRVKEGDLVCELDASLLRDQLTTQTISTRQAESNLLNATKSLQVAEIALNEYQGGTLPQALQDAEASLTLAETTLKQAQDRCDWSRMMLAKNLIPPATNQANEISLLNAEISVTLARSKIELIGGFTKMKKTTELKAAVERTRVDLEASKATYDLNVAKQEKLERQIKMCMMYAPADGLVVYANESNRPGRTAPAIEAGQLVRQRQKVFSIPDITNMRIATRIHEAEIVGVEVGCKVKLEAQGHDLTGTVTMVRNVPELLSRDSAERYYTTWIKVDNPPDVLRPGMTASYEILVSQDDNVLTVPVQSVLSIRNQSFVFLQNEGSPEMRQVELGKSNNKLIEITAGLNEGDKVALSPISLMSDEAIRKAFGNGSKHIRSDEWNDVAPASATASTASSRSTEENQLH